jgi:predicted nuclease with TOPRIM domain
VCRVEGRGDATIHDVTISNLPNEKVSTSEAYQRLEDESKRVEDSIQRNSVTVFSLRSYIQSMKMENVDPAKLPEILESFDSASEKLDSKAVELKKRQEELTQLKIEERSKITAQLNKDKLKMKASIGMFVEHEGEVEIVLIYGVYSTMHESPK